MIKIQNESDELSHSGCDFEVFSVNEIQNGQIWVVKIVKIHKQNYLSANDCQI